jgi:cytochrome oxidase Cu insertion factor (SCO1/SenC/PrrC family)
MKRVLMLVGILILVVSLIACGNAADTEEVVAETNTENVEEEVVENTEEPVVSEEDDDSEPELAVGKRIPNYELKTLEGETVSLHDYDGKIILLNFWATW